MPKRPRIHYFDVAKGLLIMLVVLHHIPQVVKSNGGLDEGLWHGASSLNYLYACYFMQTFFFISGACSNFGRPFFDFLKRTLTGILLPAFLLPIVTIWIINVLNLDFHLSSYGLPSFKKFLMWGPSGWFLAALFLSRLIYWAVHRLLPTLTYRLIAGLLLLVGACLLNQYDLIPNYWYHRHALGLVIFLAIGQWYRQYEHQKYLLWIGSALFVLLTIALQVTGTKYCWITNAYHVSLLQIPQLLAMGITGSCMIIGIARLIDHHRIIEYLGRNSLWIYVFQWDFLCWMVMHCHNLLPEAGLWLSLALFVAFFVATFAMASLIALLLNTRYLRFCLGKM